MFPSALYPPATETAKSSAAQLLPVFGLPARIVRPSATICGTAHFGSLNSRATRSAAVVSLKVVAPFAAPLGLPRSAFHAASAAARGSNCVAFMPPAPVEHRPNLQPVAR